jgi:hypothetical protein
MVALTSLETIPAFTAAIRRQLADYWITSAEEFISTARASNHQYGNGLAALAQVLELAEDDIRGLVQSAQAIVVTDLTYDVMADPVLGTGAIFEGMAVARALPFDLPLEDLPAEKRLAAGLTPPRAQGRRNTCVAFTLAAMIQQMSDPAIDLSPQFAYWACKERDGIPGDVGTRPDIALLALIDRGICQEQTWAYNPDPDDRNPGQGPPPGQALAEAQSYRASDMIALPPNDIHRIKATIAAGRSVLIGLAVQEHWTSTWQAWILGRIRPPLPGELSRSGHAMLAVGYRDDPRVPGNGYFIVRNSWGTTWGKQNADGARYAHIPYQVVFASNRAAFAITAVTVATSRLLATTPAGVAAPAMSAGVIQDLQALYQEAQQLVAVTLQDLAKLNQLMLRIGGLIQPPAHAEAQLSPRQNTPPLESPLLRDRHGLSGPLVIIGAGAHDPHPMLAPNGILATTGQPLLTIDTVAALALARAAAPANKENDPDFLLHQARLNYDQNDHFGMALGEENCLAQAGWAIVVHADEDAALIQALSPLIIKRCDDQGLPRPALEFRAGETCSQWLQRSVANVNAPLQSRIPVLLYRTGESAGTWLARHGIAQGPVDPQRGVPFYLALVGRPGAYRANETAIIPFAFQYELDLFWGVGRLCFTNPQTGQHNLRLYSDYAERVVAIEQAATPVCSKHIVYFGTRHDLDIATQRSAAELVTPLFQGRPGQPTLAQKLGFTQQLFLADQATRANLDRILRGTTEHGTPALLFTASHGIGFPADDPRLPAQQGALICQDWTGLGSIKREHWYAAEDLVAETRVGGLIAVCFACYGAGCPQVDQFVFKIGQNRPVIAPAPIVAQLPQQLLARGALAVLGHVDRAWTHSFSAAGTPAQTQRFESVLGRLMKGDRLGFATDQFNMAQGQVATRLTDLLEHERFGQDIDPSELSTLWVARNDARNYAVLGDPAVRLPFS